MRISADTGPTWYPEFPLPWWDNGTLPSLRAMIRNSVTRTGLGHRWWHNDPDCLLLGETTNLTHSEIVSAATIIGYVLAFLKSE
jgi:alpha-galactosidase